MAGISESQVQKRIISRAHLQAFLDSETHNDVVSFVEQLNNSVIGVKLSTAIEESPVITSLLAVLDKVEQIARESPAVENGKSRFGNPAFKTFYDRIVENAEELHRTIPGLDKKGDIALLAVYFCESWGNRTRVDYGSGMELNFICWLLCLQKLGVIREEDSQAVVLRVFWKYMQTARLLQTQYWLEPAGSHGAQGLDDYHFAVFIFGSAQLSGHKHIRPKAIHDRDILEECTPDYMYLGYIRYINSIKTESLRWHSPMLDDISAVKTWQKINEGMLKMYKAEVLAKLPVAQHFLFSRLLPFPNVDEAALASSEDTDVHTDKDGHLHVKGQGFGDCCGIPIPSAFAAAAAERGQQQGGTLGSAVRRIPFD